LPVDLLIYIYASIYTSQVRKLPTPQIATAHDPDTEASCLVCPRHPIDKIGVHYTVPLSLLNKITFNYSILDFHASWRVHHTNIDRPA
jgi:hypothetical protein